MAQGFWVGLSEAEGLLGAVIEEFLKAGWSDRTNKAVLSSGEYKGNNVMRLSSQGC
jgi:hypothetical protein